MFVRNLADRWSVTRALLGPVLLFVPVFFDLPLDYRVVALVLFVIGFGDMNYILHLHVHRAFSDKVWFNYVLDACLGVMTGMTASNWRIQHVVGHHRGNDAPYRIAGGLGVGSYSLWGALRYSFGSIWPTFWRPIVESYEKGVADNVNAPIHYRWAFIEQSLFIVVVLVLLALYPRFTLFFLLPWYVWIAVMTRYVDYLNHYGCDEQSSNVYERSNNSLDRLFNRSCQNFGYHTAHHLRPTAHWTELPVIHSQIAHRIPERCLKRFSWLIVLLPYHCILGRVGRA